MDVDEIAQGRRRTIEAAGGTVEWVAARARWYLERSRHPAPTPQAAVALIIREETAP